jgi:transposase
MGTSPAAYFTLNTHVSAAMRQMIDARDWLHVIRLPAYAPDLNPVEAVWSHLNAASATSPSAASTSCKPSSRTGSKASSTAPTYSTASSLIPA